MASASKTKEETDENAAFMKELADNNTVQCTELCFNLCVSSFYTQNLMFWEKSCFERCAEKYHAMEKLRDQQMAKAEPIIKDVERRFI